VISRVTILFLTCIALANATAILTVSVLQNPVPQSASAPCIICGTTQAHNPATFGYNNFDTTGNTSMLTLFSTNLFESLASGVQETPANDYSVGEIEGVLANNVSFGVAIDVNSAEGGNPPTIMQLLSFQMIDVTTNTLLASTVGTTALPDIRPGNGMGDYLISGFNLTGDNLNDRIVFRAQFSGATDGPDSFYLVTQAAVEETPEPAVLFLIGSGLVGLSIYRRYSKPQSH
jgi:hypothetical protein